MSRKKGRKWNGEPYKQWDVRLKPVVAFVSALVAVIGLPVGVYEYNRSRADQLQIQQRSVAEAEKAERRKRQERQLELFARLNSVTGKLAADLMDKEQARKDVQEFEALYWGEQAYIEEPGILDELHKLHLDLLNLTEDYNAGDKLTKESRRERDNNLKLRVLNLGKKLKEETQKILDQQ